jgi:nicotinate (nicotinamide) nucleotide adenylyltransferase
MHIALLGLSGDPPHLGHLAVAQSVKAYGYTRVWWLLTPQNPAKAQATTPYWHRRELARLLTAPHRDWLEVSDFEAGVAIQQESLRTYTVLKHLKSVMPEASFTFVMGADNWADAQTGFHTWEYFMHILPLASILVLPRSPWTDMVPKCPASLVLAEQQDKAFHGPVAPGMWRLAGQAVDHPAQSTHIRQQLAKGGTTPHLTAAQLAYIQAEGLYR